MAIPPTLGEIKAAAGLIVAAALEKLAKDYDEAVPVYGERSQRLQRERPEGTEWLAEAERAMGKALLLEQEARALRLRAQALRGEA